MAERHAQEFWDQMWYWEHYEQYPGEDRDDPHLVIILGAQVDQAAGAGQQPDPKLMERFDHCVGRVLDRLTNLWPRSGSDVNLDEVKLWLRFGLDKTHRGHDGVVTPIIDADSLVNFLKFTRYAQDFCTRHQLADLGQLWAAVDQAARQVEQEHRGAARSSRFDAAGAPSNQENAVIKFKDVQAYLDAIAAKNGGIAASPHGAFWQTVYTTFTTGQVPNVGVPIMDTAHPLQSPFFVILTDPNGFQGIPQMPAGGPFITDRGYQVALADGTMISGKDIIANLTDWLSHGYPQ